MHPTDTSSATAGRRRPRLASAVAVAAAAAIAASAGVLTTAPGAAADAPNPILYWADQIVSAVTTPTPSASSPLLARNYALIHGAIHAAVEAAESASPHGKQPFSVFEGAAVSYAAHGALSRVFPNAQRGYDAALVAWLGAATAGLDAATAAEVVEKGKKIGVKAARNFVTDRDEDGYSAYVPYNTTGTNTTGPIGVYVATPPSYLWPPVSPNGRYITPFVLTSPISAFRAPPPPAINSTAYLTAVQEVNSVGVAGAQANRTSYETQTAYFWLEPTPTRFNKLARLLVGSGTGAAGAFGVRETAKLFAALNFAIADASIAAWDTKYEYNTWRPVSVFRRNATFLAGGVNVYNAGWTPLIATPDHQDYPSNHATAGRAAVTVLQALLGTDAVSVTYSINVTTDSVGVLTRTYNSLDALSDENARSRVLGGIHFAFAGSEGQAVGKKVAQAVLAAF